MLVSRVIRFPQVVVWIRWLRRVPLFPHVSRRHREHDTRTTPDDEFRILAVGESTTYGLGVGRENAYPAQLERLLNENCDARFVVISTGVPGQTILMEYS